MKEIVVGTKNSAKVEQIRGALLGLVDVVGIPNSGELPEVTEDGPTARDNSRKKALTYAQILRKPVLSMDNALYFKELEGNESQPGLNVRRLNGEGRASDEEMIAYYSKLVESLGGKAEAWWEFAVCVATPEGKLFEKTIVSPRIFVSVPSNSIVEGYPLESIQVDPVSGKYISEMNSDEQSDFWKRNIGRPLFKFVSSIKV